MLARSLALVLTALSAASAWPIFFYESTNCNHYPVFTLEKPPQPNVCYSFGRVDIRSYSGGTGNSIEKLLFYTSLPACHRDAAHHAYANYTISNSTTTCASFPKVPRSYVFIEEILGPLPVCSASYGEGFTLEN